MCLLPYAAMQTLGVGVGATVAVRDELAGTLWVGCAHELHPALAQGAGGGAVDVDALVRVGPAGGGIRGGPADGAAVTVEAVAGGSVEALKRVEVAVRRRRSGRPSGGEGEEQEEEEREGAGDWLGGAAAAHVARAVGRMLRQAVVCEGAKLELAGLDMAGEVLRMEGKGGETPPRGGWGRVVGSTDVEVVTVAAEEIGEEGSGEAGRGEEETAGSGVEGEDEDFDSEAVQLLCEMVEAPLRLGRALAAGDDRGVSDEGGLAFLDTCTRGLILHGPPGVGKTYAVKVVSRRMGVPVVTLESYELLGEEGPELKRKLERLARRATQAAVRMGKRRGWSVGVSILFMDEIDSFRITGVDDKEEGRSPLDEKVRRNAFAVAALLGQLNVLLSPGGGEPVDGVTPVVLAVGATNHVTYVDECLRRDGLFEKTAMITVPGPAMRRKLLVHQLRHVLADVPDEFVPGERHWFKELVYERTQGFVASDMMSLAREAQMAALVRALGPRLAEFDATMELPDDLEIEVAEEDFTKALGVVGPSIGRGLAAGVNGKITEATDGARDPGAWDLVGGLEDAKLEMQQAIEWPITRHEAFQSLGLRPSSGVLLYGPPGCSKTTLVRCAAAATGMSLVPIKGDELYSSYLGESERMLRELFATARQIAPCIVFIDEIDTIVSNRNQSMGSGGSSGGGGGQDVSDRLLSTLLNEIDGVETGATIVRNGNLPPSIFLVGATNRPDMIDDALLRPGRLDAHIYIPPPDAKAREQVLRIHTSRMPLDLEGHGDYFSELARAGGLLEGFSGAEIEGLCREAAMSAMREAKGLGDEDLDSLSVKRRHFEQAAKAIKPMITQDMLDFFHRFRDRNAKLVSAPKV